MTSFDFSPLFRTTVGFDRLARLLEDSLEWGEAAGGYPPYNIEKTGEDRYRITLAVAGFSEEELAVTVHENTLLVEGRRREQGGNTPYLHRGIASRSFRRQFQLADYVRVVTGNLNNGLLTIDLVREVPEAVKPRKIEIKTSPPSDTPSKQPHVIQGRKGAA